MYSGRKSLLRIDIIKALCLRICAGSCLAVFTGHQNYFMYSMFSTNESLAVTDSMNQNIIIWGNYSLSQKHFRPTNVMVLVHDQFHAAVNADLFARKVTVVK